MYINACYCVEHDIIDIIKVHYYNIYATILIYYSSYLIVILTVILIISTSQDV
jgi:hypothetical protein